MHSLAVQLHAKRLARVINDDDLVFFSAFTLVQEALDSSG
jgi:hypothetical protein